MPTIEFSNATVGGTEHIITKSTSFSLTNNSPLERAPTRIEPVIFLTILTSSFSLVKVNLNNKQLSIKYLKYVHIKHVI